jgi:hypothetical protein
LPVTLPIDDPFSCAQQRDLDWRSSDSVREPASARVVVVGAADALTRPTIGTGRALHSIASLPRAASLQDRLAKAYAIYST